MFQDTYDVIVVGAGHAGTEHHWSMTVSAVGLAFLVPPGLVGALSLGVASLSHACPLRQEAGPEARPAECRSRAFWLGFWASLPAWGLALLLWLHTAQGLSWIHAALAVAALDLVLAGVFVRVGGQLLKGPYLPQTTAGLSKTTRALLGR